MFDPAARAEICQAIDGYLSDRLSAFVFDEQLRAIRDRTQDRTAHAVVDFLWLLYDDCDDHLVCLDKQSWDTIQRLKLILLSGAEIHTEQRHVWHASQLFAAACLAAIAYVCSLEIRLWPVPVLTGGLVSIALARWRRGVHQSHEIPDPRRAWPFSSPAAIARALRRCRGFRKKRHRVEVAQRSIRPASADRVHRLHFLFAWCHYSPIPLLFQCLPLSITHARATDCGRRETFAA